MTNEETEKDFGFYPEHDCGACNGTGWVKVAECICQTCKSAYIARLEKIIYNCVDEDTINNNGVHMGVYMYVLARVEEHHEVTR